MQTYTALFPHQDTEEIALAMFDELMDSPLRDIVADWYSQARVKIKTDRQAKIFVVRVVEYAAMDDKKRSERLALARQIQHVMKG